MDKANAISGWITAIGTLFGAVVAFVITTRQNQIVDSQSDLFRAQNQLIDEQIDLEVFKIRYEIITEINEIGGRINLESMITRKLMRRCLKTCLKAHSVFAPNEVLLFMNFNSKILECGKLDLKIMQHLQSKGHGVHDNKTFCQFYEQADNVLKKERENLVKTIVDNDFTTDVLFGHMLYHQWRPTKFDAVDNLTTIPPEQLG